MDKKGLVLLPLIAYVFLAFIAVIFVGIFIYGLLIFDDAMTGTEIIIGDFNFTDVYEETTGQGVNAIISLADFTLTALLFGMIFVMMIVGYYWGDEKKRLWMILDLFIIIVCFVIAAYLQNYFLDIIALKIIDPTIYTDTIPKASRIIVNLPFIIPVIGVLIMVVTYGFARKKREDVAGELGF